MKNEDFNPGFRLSIFDLAVIILGLAGAWYLRDISNEFSLVILFVLGHFFYFCNISRMSRMPEIIWAICFVISYGVGVFYGIVTVAEAFVISFIITIVLTVLEARKPSYHGVLWSKINPGAQDWFDRNKATKI
ncbi:hypothetical protein NBRC116583_05580 [Arenicella sp. 4NH20-0111]|uniref:hypothetical protein n=1 Tax=Arenicella sp. 4NH20-0111 TaxID=3127648 RepID=UPI00310711E7